MNQSDIQNTKVMSSAIGSVSGLYQRWAKDAGYNICHVQTLCALYLESAVTQKQICDRYQLPKQTVNGVILSLLHQGVIEMETSKQDRRGKTIVLTEKGIEYAKEVLSPLIELHQKVVAKIGKTKYNQLLGGLSAYNNALSSELEKK